jgi:hypothetical protein
MLRRLKRMSRIRIPEEYTLEIEKRELLLKYEGREIASFSNLISMKSIRQEIERHRASLETAENPLELE